MDRQEPPPDVLPHAETEVPDWNDFRLLTAVLRAGSLTKAARSLGLSQATVSRQMDKLERNVGVRLLERSTSGAELTPLWPPASPGIARGLGKIRSRDRPHEV